MPALPTGLVRNKNGQYYLRRRIPKDLIASYDNKKELLWSLKTSNFRDALDFFRLDDARLMLEWERRRQKRADFLASRQLQTATVINELTQENLDLICRHYESASLAGDEQRREDGTYDLSEIEDYQQAYREGIVPLKAAVAIGDVETLGPILQQFLDLYHYRVNIPDTDYRRLAIAIGRTAIRNNENLLRRYDGEDIQTPQPDVRVQHLLSAVVKDYMDKYQSEKHAPMFKKVKAVLPMFLEVVGDKPIHKLRQTDILHFFDVVQLLPPRWKDISRQRKLNVMQVAELGLPAIGPGTFDGTYKAAVTPFLEWSSTHWQDAGFPTTLTTNKITYTGPREEGEMQQRAFHLNELKRLFAGSEMQLFAKDPEEAHRFWFPHVGLFTGARGNELCQINPQVDIRKDKETGIWFFDITEDSESHAEVVKAVKTDKSKRKVPIHSTLINLGFLDYVNWVRGKGDTLLFEKFPPSVGRAAPKAMAWFKDFLILLQLRDETPHARLVGYHAYRSTFLSHAEDLGVVNAEAITGHVSGTISAVQGGQIAGSSTAVLRKYRGELALKVKQEILERITWEGLEFIRPRHPKLSD